MVEFIFEELKTIEWHDQDIEKFTLDFINKELLIKISLFDENINDFLSVEYNFKDVENFYLSEIVFNNLNGFEIYSKDINFVDNNKMCLNLQILIGFEKQSVEYNFDFRKCYKLT